MTGVFISFEGGEGSGKTTQIKHLAAWVGERFIGRATCITREPGGTEPGELIRDLLVNGAANCWQPASEALMMSASRHEHVVGVIRPALARGEIVISDRFADSTHVYQGYVGGISAELLDALDTLSCEEVWPDLTFLLDMNSADGLARAERRGAGEDRFEAKGALFHERVRDGFVQRAKNDPERIVIIDASRSERVIADEIAEHVSRLFTARGIA